MAERSPTRELINLRLQTTVDTSLDALVHELRNGDPRMSWRDIARRIYEDTGNNVTETTLRNWYPELVGARS